MKRFPALLALLLLLLLTLSACEASERELQGRVTWIYDGDTIEVAGAGRVRLLGIDVPEGDDSDRDAFFIRNWKISPERLRRIAEEAKSYNIREVRGTSVRLVFDPHRDRRDRHGRLLAYVVLPDGRILNRILLDQGYAVVYRRFDFDRRDEFLNAEDEARRRKIGVWAD